MVLGIGLIYLLLTLGGFTMVYPYLVTVTSAMSNEYDYESFNPYPAYWFDGGERYLKYLAEKYSGQSRFVHFKAAYGADESWYGFRDVAFAENVLDEHFPLFGAEASPQRWEKLSLVAKDYFDFIDSHYATRQATENLLPLFLSYNLPAYYTFARDRYEGLYLESVADKGTTADDLSTRELESRALSHMAIVRGDLYVSFADMSFKRVANYGYDLTKWLPRQTARHVDFIDWIRSRPASEKMPVTRHYLWTKFLYDSGMDTKDYNSIVGEDKAVKSLMAAPYPSRRVPVELAKLEIEFVQKRWPARLMRLVGDRSVHRQAYLARLKERYQSLDGLNKVAGTKYSTWDNVPDFLTLPYPHEQMPAHQVDRTRIDALTGVWRDYVLSVPVAAREMISPETDYQKFLSDRYGSVGAINRAYGWSVARVADIQLPFAEADYYHYVQNRGHFFWKFVSFNFIQVVSFVATKGRALWNTLILVVLTIVATLTVNPLAAYALSRFQLRGTQFILVFLLATMAFPPEVAMIPAFLLLRDLGMLNTFAALILPSLANGFSIFLLKGFFDSLPKELYEAASLDGASEVKMFTTITFPLCKPILAVIALQAFIAAYGGFMWAFLVCQDQKMWTLMVFLYQFQQEMADYPWMTMAGLVLASIPTLIVFLFCQKIILRGIIIPTMK